MLERLLQMGLLEKVRTVYRYDDRDHVTEEVAERHDRQTGVDSSGAPCISNEDVSWCETHYEYVYDAEQNWIERVTSSRDDRSAKLATIVLDPRVEMELRKSLVDKNLVLQPLPLEKLIVCLANAWRKSHHCCSKSIESAIAFLVSQEKVW